MNTANSNTYSDHRKELSLHYAGWRVVIACFVMAVFSWGFGFYGQGVYLVALQQQHHWDTSLISGASTAYYLFSAVLIMFVGGTVTRFGPRRVVLSGMVCLAVATFLVGRITTPWQLYLVYVLMSLGWAATSSAAITSIISAWFSRRRGLAITVALGGASAGGMVVTPLQVMLIGRIGLPDTLMYAAVLMVVILVPITLAWMHNPADTRKDEKEATTSVRTTTRMRREALGNPGFRTVVGGGAVALFAQVGFLVLEIDFLAPRIGQTEAGVAVAVTAAFSIIGRIMLAGVVDRLNPRLFGAACYLSQGLALFAMLWTTNTTALFAACAVFGFSVGNVLVIPALIIQREFEARAFPLLISLALAITQFIYALSPGTLGLLRSTTGSYQVPLMLCVALEIIAAVIILSRANPEIEAQARP